MSSTDHLEFNPAAVPVTTVTPNSRCQSIEFSASAVLSHSAMVPSGLSGGGVVDAWAGPEESALTPFAARAEVNTDIDFTVDTPTELVLSASWTASTIGNTGSIRSEIFLEENSVTIGSLGGIFLPPADEDGSGETTVMLDPGKTYTINVAMYAVVAGKIDGTPSGDGDATLDFEVAFLRPVPALDRSGQTTLAALLLGLGFLLARTTRAWGTRD